MPVFIMLFKKKEKKSDLEERFLLALASE